MLPKKYLRVRAAAPAASQPSMCSCRSTSRVSATAVWSRSADDGRLAINQFAVAHEERPQRGARQDDRAMANRCRRAASLGRQMHRVRLLTGDIPSLGAFGTTGRAAMPPRLSEQLHQRNHEPALAHIARIGKAVVRWRPVEKRGV